MLIKNSLLSERLPLLPEWDKASFGSLIKTELSRAIQLQPDKEDFVFSLFESSVNSLKELKKNPKKLISYTRGSHQKNNMMIWNDKLNSYKHGQPTQELSTMLLKILARELTLKEKACKPFWTHACKELSEMWPLPTVIDYQDLDLISSNPSLTKQEEKLPSLMIQETNHQNKNLQKTCSVSYISTVVDKWAKDHIKENKKEITKTISLTFHPTQEQKILLDQNLRVSNFVYNKTVNYINTNKGEKFSKLDLRDKLVTNNTRKGCLLFNKLSKAKKQIRDIINGLVKTKKLKNVVLAVIIKLKVFNFIKSWYDYVKANTQAIKNQSLKPFEVNVHKDIRANAVFECFTNYMNCMKAVKSGRIRFFQLKYKNKSKNRFSMGITKTMLKLDDETLRFCDRSLIDKKIRLSNRTKKVLRSIKDIKDSTITKVNGVYKLRIPVVINIPEKIELNNIVGIDPGVSTFLNMYTPEKSITIKQSSEITSIDKLRKHIKSLRKNNQRKRIRKKLLTKLDSRQSNLVDELHWQSINYLVKNYDLIFLEKFETHNFVKNGKSKSLNRNTNNLKHYKFRERLEYKTSSLGKIVSLVDAHHTTMTCSSCGMMKKMRLSDRIYECNSCKVILDRDLNSGKNILLKGLLC